MGILDYANQWLLLSRGMRSFNSLVLLIILIISTGCSTFSSYVFFVPQEESLLIHDVERRDWITTNQGYGSVRPPLKSIEINEGEKLTIYPIRSSGNIETFGPPLLPIIWIPRFMHLPPSNPLNVLRLIHIGGTDEIRIVFVNDMPIAQNSLEIERREGETHYYLSIPTEIVKKKTLGVNVAVGGSIMHIKFDKSRSKNWFPLFIPL